ncbi:MAG: 3-dehydroquinate synthase [Clostridia bacterium]|nr:3-dehydroquinate synthase [Clostridia bacterium]
MKKLTVHASRSYDIVIGAGLLGDAGAYCKEALGGARRLCIVSDDTVASLYLNQTKESLEAVGFSVEHFVFPHGETSKNTEVLVSLWEFLAERRFTRSDALVALGGGVVGDLCGFCAATFLRGIRFVQIPTTLLAAVDSSVGGKTAVDLRVGKNLVGAFYQPSIVIFDIKTLDTLPREIFSDGCAEVVKYAMIGDRALFDDLSGDIRESIEDIIARCVLHKAEIVEGDEFDRGRRQLLNLGHTFGHAIEACSNLQISHGSAVAMGLVMATRAAVRLGICPSDDLSALIALLERLSLPTECPYSAKELICAALADKKRMGDTVTFVLPFGIGDSRLYPVSVSEMTDLFEKGLTK